MTPSPPPAAAPPPGLTEAERAELVERVAQALDGPGCVPLELVQQAADAAVSALEPELAAGLRARRPLPEWAFSRGQVEATVKAYDGFRAGWERAGRIGEYEEPPDAIAWRLLLWLLDEREGKDGS